VSNTLPPTRPRPFVFTLMPFTPEYEDTYRLAISAACEAAGAYCERVDEQIFHESILQRIYNQIAKADLIVADMSDRNPNVFYEVGYAHALGKRVVLLTRHAEDIPFDLKHYPHIVYGSSLTQLRQQLERQVRAYIADPSRDEGHLENILSFFCSGVPITAMTELRVDQYRQLRHFGPQFTFELAIHNGSNQVYSGGREQIGLVTPQDTLFFTLDEDGFHESIRLPENLRLTFMGEIPRILPGGWHALHSRVRVPDDRLVESIPIIVRRFSAIGPADLPFSIKARRGH
jgi:hypothetical protein